MIRRLPGVPALFAGWPAQFEWYALCASDRGLDPDAQTDAQTGGPETEASASALPAGTLAVAGLDWTSIPGGVGLHLEIVPGTWGKAAFRACGEALSWLKDEARRRGVRSIVGSSTNAQDARRWFKFTELYGFTDQTTMIFAFCRLDQTTAEKPGENAAPFGETRR